MRLAMILGVVAVLAGCGPAGAQSTPLTELVRQRIRYVFVIYQENRSFDHYFGTFPGANGIYTDEARAHGFSQYNPVAQHQTQAFRIVEPEVGVLSNHRDVFNTAIDGGAMDKFVSAQATAAQKSSDAASIGDEAMAHVDCDTIPFLWMYASRFALYDSFFQGVRGPSTPSNVEIIAAQNGETQYARHGGPGVPIWNDLDPAFGPYNPGEHSAQHQIDQTYATVLLNLEGAEAGSVTNDTQDVADDIAFLRTQGRPAVKWKWYQQGFADPAHLELVTHHLAPHYFGYIAQNSTMEQNVADISTFASDVENANLGDGGLFYLKGGFGSNLNLRPPNAKAHTFLGDDDHPGESDSQIAEADVAALVDTIARSKYWSQSAILITWDDPGGFWDHVPPPTWIVCPGDDKPCGNGQRVPLLLISPYARNAVVNELDDQSSVVKFAEQLFNRTPLAQLPDEARFMPMGPRDASTATGDLTGGFDPARLRGDAPPIAADAAIIPDDVIRTIPSAWSCRSIDVTPVPPPAGTSDAPPPGFNPRGIVITLPTS
ncbi:MAG: phosphoesterase [Candidatus Eremiobacteraeota bacterium]|nr:phosphoesterase [Candidatus Eremiobacteraeota bacterium]